MPKLSKEDNAILKDLLEDIKTDMISQQNALGIRASGASADSLTVTSSGKGPNLTGKHYWAFLFDDTGRGPGGFPLPQEIEDWIFDKGIEILTTLKNTIFNISFKIAKEGTDIYQGKPGVKISEIITEHLIAASGRIARAKVRKILEPFRKNKTL